MIDAAATVRAGALSAAGGTDPGRVRTENEDRFYVDVDRGIFLVADGVGGHAAGEVAATIAVDVIVQRLERPTWSAEQRVREAIALANNAIVREAQASPGYAGMTCVLTLAIVSDQRVTIGHVGDSRLYKLSPRGIEKLTRDHSPVGEREDAREITEIEAMRHPRRNEVFRDVGSTFHEPDAPDFIDIVETTFERDSALLLCSDGLSDMITSTAIEREVRQHAGHPAAVVAALIAAANEVGGKDNVTAVYIEGDRFASTPRLVPARVERLTPPTASGGSLLRRTVSHRTTWLVAGLLAGIAATVATLLYWPLLDPIGSAGRMLVVGPMPAPYATIAEAIGAARPRDVVQIEPGDYRETVVLKDGVTLTARLPGTVTVEAPRGRTSSIGIVAAGNLGSRISGIAVRGRPDAPMQVGIRLSGHDLVLDDVTVEGDVAVAVDVVNDGAIVVKGSRFAPVNGLSMRVGPGARPSILQNVFARAGGSERAVAIDVGVNATPELRNNVFAGYLDPLEASAAHDDLLRGNFIVHALDRGVARTERP